jgi:hypothetical protein
MPIRFAAPPRNGETLVRAGIGKLAARNSPRDAALTDTLALQLYPPHAVYDLRADSLARGEGLAASRQTAFRYLVSKDSGPVAAAEVQADPEGIADLLANINQGPYVEASARALDQVQQLPSVQQGRYEARLLRCSAIYLVALWLKPEDTGSDIIYPLAPAPPGLQAEQPYTVDDFLKIVVPLAQERVATSEPPKVP